ncbi:hypothetical protein ACRRTK_013667 [Alexandromys fortis]
MASNVDEEALHQLYLWVDNIPLSRPKRNLSRDFSDGVLVAELIKFYFPKMVEMHNYVPANSLQQKLSNWGHLNRKVLNKLNFSVPDDVMRKIAQCSPGVVELVLIPLRQRLEERQRRQKLGAGSLQELASQDVSGYMDMGLSQKTLGDGAPALGGEQLRGGRPPAPRPPGYNQALQGDPSFVLQIAEKEQELLASQETVQVLQMKVKRLEHLLQLKNVRIDDLSRRLQQAERKQRIGRAERAAHWRPLQQRRSDTEGSGERGGVQSRDLGLILLLTLHPGQEKRPLSTAQKTCADIRHDLPNRVNFEAPSAGPGEAVLRFLSQLRGQPCLHPCKFSMASDTRAATPGSGGILLPLLGASMGPISELETTAAGEEGIRC